MTGGERRHPRLAVLLTIALVVAGCGGDPDRDEWSQGEDPARPVRLEPLPAALPLSGSPAEQSGTVAAAFAAGGEQRLAAAVAAFGAAGIPILDPEGRSLTTDPTDIVGIPWFVVAAVVGTSTPGTGVTLADLATSFGADEATSTLDSEQIGDDLLGALRQAVNVDSDPELRFVAELVRAETFASETYDLADPSVTAAQVTVSVPTALLLVSAAIRSAVAAVAAPSPGSFADDGPVIGPPGPPAPNATPSLPPGCATDAAGQWALWLVSKVAAGTPVGGIGNFGGAFQTVLDHLVDTLKLTEYTNAQQRLKRIGSVASAVNALINVTTLIAAILTLSSSAELEGGEPLVRTQTTTPGKNDKIKVKVFYDYGKLDPTTVDALNCILSLLAIVGNNNTLPPSGPASGVEVSVTGLYGFADRLDTSQAIVLFGPEGYEIRQTANDQGEVTVPVQGRAQKRDISRPTPSPVIKAFAIDVESTIDPVDLSSLSRNFLDGFQCAGSAIGAVGSVGGNPAAECLNVISNIVKGWNWDLGGWEFKLKDWESCLPEGPGRAAAAAPVCTADSTATYAVESSGTLDLRDPNSPLWSEHSIEVAGSYTVVLDVKLRNVGGGWLDNGSTYNVSGSVTTTTKMIASEGGTRCTGTETKTYSGSGSAGASVSPRPEEGTAIFSSSVGAEVHAQTEVSGTVDNPYGEDLSCEGVVGTTGSTTTSDSIQFNCPLHESGVEVPYRDGATSVDLSCTDTFSYDGTTATYTVAGAIALP